MPKMMEIKAWLGPPVRTTYFLGADPSHVTTQVNTRSENNAKQSQEKTRKNWQVSIPSPSLLLFAIGASTRRSRHRGQVPRDRLPSPAGT